MNMHKNARPLKAVLVRRVRTRAVDKGGLIMKKEVQGALETAIAGKPGSKDRGWAAVRH